MDIVSTKDMLLDARKNNYAIPAFNIHNLETMQAVLEGAREMKSPIIVATTPGTVNYAGVNFLVNMAKAGAKNFKIPIALHLDHCGDVDFVKNCISAGYKSVMIDASLKEYEENIRLTKEVVEFAEKYGATVESELGVVGGREEERKVDEKDALYTDPNMALDFVEKTKIDSLAVAIGTAHGLYKLEPKLDIDRLEEIRNAVCVPLVLHGASGVPEESVKEAVKHGICKINVSTELKMAFIKEIKKYLKENPSANDPRHYLTPGKEAIKNIVIDKIKICGCENRA